MKKFITLFIALLVSASAFAQASTKWFYAFAPNGQGTKIYNVVNSASASAGQITWNDSWTNGYWYSLDGEGNKVWSTSVVDTALAEIVYGASEDYLGNRPVLTMNLGADKTLTFASFELGGSTGTTDDGARAYFGSTPNVGNVIITGDLKKSSAKSSFIYNAKSIYVGGSILSPGGNLAFEQNAVGKLEVAKDIKGAGSIFTNIYGNGSFANPSVLVHGVINGMTLYSKPLNDNSSVSNYIQVGGLTNGASIRREAPATFSATGNGTTYVTFTNTANYSTAGTISEQNGSKWKANSSGILTYIMNGTASQSFETNSAFMHGGIKVLSGAIYMNFNQNTGIYTYKDSDTNTVTFFTSKGGTTRTQFSHGNLEMGVAVNGLTSAGSEAIFGSIDSSTSYGAFRFTNIVYKSGTIKLRLTSATQVDSLDLTSYAMYNSALTGEAQWVDVAGGTITKTDDALSPVTFNFGNTLLWLIDDGSGDFDINGGLGAKIISWDSSKKTSLTEKDFAANKYSSAGDDFDAKFTITDDGLYVKYIAAVPEPATLAAILAVLAISFAAYRRRK